MYILKGNWLAFMPHDNGHMMCLFSAEPGHFLGNTYIEERQQCAGLPSQLTDRC